MGKKRIVTDAGKATEGAAKASSTSTRKKLLAGLLYIQSTYNNTRVSLTDPNGNLVASSSSGAIGFRGAKKGTPFAAAKVGEIVADKGKLMGLKSVDVIVKGVGAGRESAIRSFSSKGIAVTSIQDRTPIPHNGTRPPKPRRV